MRGHCVCHPDNHIDHDDDDPSLPPIVHRHRRAERHGYRAIVPDKTDARACKASQHSDTFRRVTSGGLPDGPRPLRLLVCWRPVAARADEVHIVTRVIRDLGNTAEQTTDAPVDLSAFDAVLILENANWFPQILRQVERCGSDHGPSPLLAVWHWEPLPMPPAADVVPPRLSAREIAKIVLRDSRATDIHTNRRFLRRLHHNGLPHLLAVSSQAWQETLAGEGIPAHWIPYGYEPGDGAPSASDLTRDIQALFVGALEVPRRKSLIRQLRRNGVTVAAYGSWTDKQLWGHQRSELISRAQAFLNLQRYPGEVSAHRMILGMAHRALVVSEPIYRPAPFVSGEHYVEAPAADMPRVLNHYATHPIERDRIVDRAFRFVTEELRMESSIAQLVSLITAHRDVPRLEGRATA